MNSFGAVAHAQLGMDFAVACCRKPAVSKVPNLLFRSRTKSLGRYFGTAQNIGAPGGYASYFQSPTMNVKKNGARPLLRAMMIVDLAP
jgi:hypothetical protein